MAQSVSLGLALRSKQVTETSMQNEACHISRPVSLHKCPQIVFLIFLIIAWSWVTVEWHDNTGAYQMREAGLHLITLRKAPCLRTGWETSLICSFMFKVVNIRRCTCILLYCVIVFTYHCCWGAKESIPSIFLCTCNCKLNELLISLMISICPSLITATFCKYVICGWACVLKINWFNYCKL